MPNLQRYQDRDRITNQTRVVRQARRSFDEPGMGDVVSILGQAMGRIEEGRAQAEATKAVLATREELAKFERDLSQQGNLYPGDFERLYRDKSEEVIKRQSEAIRSRSAREAFGLRAEELRVDYGLRVDALARSRAVDEAKAASGEIGDTFTRLAADPTNAREDVEEAYESYAAVIRSQKDLGIYSAEDAQGLLVAAEEILREGVHNRHVHDIDRLLEAGRYAEAEGRFNQANQAGEILPDMREALRDDIDARGRDGMAVGLVDGMIAQGLSRSEMAARIREIDDPVLRKAVEARRDYEVRQREARKVEAQDAVFEQYGDAIREGRISSLSQIPRAERQALDQSHLNALESILRADTNAVQTDLATYATFHEMLAEGQAVEARQFLYANANKFSASDFKSLVSKSVTAQGSGGGGEIESARSLTQSINSAIERAGIKDDEAKGELLLAYDEAYQSYQRENSAEPSDQWRDETIEDLAARFKIARPGLFNDMTGPAYGIDEAGHIPQRRVQAVLAAFGTVDEQTRVKEADLEAAYNTAMAYFRINGISNPTDEALTEMIRAMREGEE